MEFSIILKNIMRERKLTQQTFAQLLKIAQSQISNWLSGKSLPNYKYIKIICEKLNLKPNDLF